YLSKRKLLPRSSVFLERPPLCLSEEDWSTISLPIDALRPSEELNLGHQLYLNNGYCDYVKLPCRGSCFSTCSK
ncbi:hypothetical protein Z043_125041, partial [Scleropages formosus]